jgi:hypothetical protein
MADKQPKITDPKIKEYAAKIFKDGFQAGKNAACDAMLAVTKRNQENGLLPTVYSQKSASDYRILEQGLADDAFAVVLQNKSAPAETIECLMLKASDRLVSEQGHDEVMGFLYGLMMNIKNKADQAAIEGAA